MTQQQDAQQLLDILFQKSLSIADLQQIQIKDAQGKIYQLVELIGEGATGRVFTVKDSKGVMRVVKIINSGRIPPEKLSECNIRLLMEYGALEKIRHQAIPIAIGVSPVNSNPPYIISAFVNGITLEQYLNEKPMLTLHEAVAILGQLLCGLAAAHREGIIHRDIKPNNIMLADGIIVGPTVRLIDFGIAKSTDTNSPKENETEVGLTNIGIILGTPLMMSPEQAKREQIGPQSDLYSLGLVFHKMIGNLPKGLREAKDPISCVVFHISKEEIPPLKLQPELATFISLLVKKDPSKRWVSAAVAAHKLAQILNRVEYSSLRSELRSISCEPEQWGMPNIKELSLIEQRQIAQPIENSVTTTSDLKYNSDPSSVFVETIDKTPDHTPDPMTSSDESWAEQATVIDSIRNGNSTSATGELLGKEETDTIGVVDPNEIILETQESATAQNPPERKDPPTEPKKTEKNKYIFPSIAAAVVGIIILVTFAILIRQKKTFSIPPIRLPTPTTQHLARNQPPPKPARKEQPHYSKLLWKTQSNDLIPPSIALSPTTMGQTIFVVTATNKLLVYGTTKNQVKQIKTCTLKQQKKSAILTDVVWHQPMNAFVLAIVLKYRETIKSTLLTYRWHGQCPQLSQWRRIRPSIPCSIQSIVRQKDEKLGVSFLVCEKLSATNAFLPSPTSFSKLIYGIMEDTPTPREVMINAHRIQLKRTSTRQNLRHILNLNTHTNFEKFPSEEFQVDGNSQCLALRYGQPGKYYFELWCSTNQSQ